MRSKKNARKTKRIRGGSSNNEPRSKRQRVESFVREAGSLVGSAVGSAVGPVVKYGHNTVERMLESPDKLSLLRATLHILEHRSDQVKPELKKDIEKDKAILKIYLKSDNYTFEQASAFYNKYAL